MDDQWLKLVGGIVFFSLGVVLIVKRSAYARWNATIIRAVWGRLGEPSAAASSTAGTVVFVALGMTVLGAVFVVTSVVSLST